jgi:hypothetical protein
MLLLVLPCQEGDDRTFGILWIHARSHHLSERALGHGIEGILEININSYYPLF